MHRATVLDGIVGNASELRRQWPTLNLNRQRAIVSALLDHAFFDTRASNAPTQSANVKIKSILRAARGFRNCGNYAARIPPPRRPAT
jgi:transposase